MTEARLVTADQLAALARAVEESDEASPAELAAGFFAALAPSALPPRPMPVTASRRVEILAALAETLGAPGGVTIRMVDSDDQPDDGSTVSVWIAPDDPSRSPGPGNPPLLRVRHQQPDGLRVRFYELPLAAAHHEISYAPPHLAAVEFPERLGDPSVPSWHTDDTPEWPTSMCPAVGGIVNGHFKLCRRSRHPNDGRHDFAPEPGYKPREVEPGEACVTGPGERVFPWSRP